MRPRAYLAIILCGAMGCATGDSTYRSKRATGGELRWAFDSGLQVTRAGEVVSQTGWSGLADAVACVEPAAAHARSARSQSIVGDITYTLGWLTVLGGAVTSTALLFAYEEPGDALVPSLATLVGSLVLGLIFVGVGASQSAKSLANGLDAVNMYNDLYVETAGCPEATPPLDPLWLSPRRKRKRKAPPVTKTSTVPTVETSTVPPPPPPPSRTPFSVPKD